MGHRLTALIAAGLLALAVNGCLPSDAEEEASSVPQSADVVMPNWEWLKAQTRTIGYRELFRNNERYVGQRFYFHGRVVRVIERGERDYDFRVAVESNSPSSAILYLAEYTGQRLLEDDQIEFVGVAAGLERYEDTSGQRVTIPRLKAVAVRWRSCANGVAVPNPQENPGLVADCDALLQARDALAGSTALWHENRPVARWYGVTVSGLPPRVTALILFERKLTGPIPPQLAALTNLQRLDLSDNQLTGPIPPELGTLANLESLRLAGNQLTGPIPPQLGTITSLQDLWLRDNQLTGPIPPQLGVLANLQQLSLSNNQLTGPIPPELGALANLRALQLHNNQLTGPIPRQFGSLANLRTLFLSDNQLSGTIPPGLGTLANLQVLYLDANQLTGAIPPELGTLANLESLSLGDNTLTGCIPEGLREVEHNDLGKLELPFCGA